MVASRIYLIGAGVIARIHAAAAARLADASGAEIAVADTSHAAMSRPQTVLPTDP